MKSEGWISFRYVMIRSSGRANVRVIQRFVEAEGTSGKNEKLFEILEEQRDKTSDGTAACLPSFLFRCCQCEQGA